MNKTKIINAIKGVFSTLGAKTSDSNYAVALLDKTSAEPKGMMDFANLASVLGVQKLSNSFYLICSNLIIGDLSVNSSPSDIIGIHEEFVTAVRAALGGPTNKTYSFFCQIGSGGRHSAQGVMYNIADTLFSEFTFTNLNGTVHISKEANGVFSLVS